MANQTLAKVAGALLVLASSCGRSPLDTPDVATGSGGVTGAGGVASTGGSGSLSTGGRGGVISTGGKSGVANTGGSGGVLAAGGSGGTVVIRFPDAGLPSLLGDGGLSALLGDGGLLGGILDARRDSFVGQVICGSEVRLGVPCSASTVGCLLPSLGGACVCAGGAYLCPINTNAPPTACPKGAATGARCSSPLSTCLGGGATACICGLGSYTCF